jgi:hypothetical protein
MDSLKPNIVQISHNENKKYNFYNFRGLGYAIFRAVHEPPLRKICVYPSSGGRGELTRAKQRRANSNYCATSSNGGDKVTRHSHRQRIQC